MTRQIATLLLLIPVALASSGCGSQHDTGIASVTDNPTSGSSSRPNSAEAFQRFAECMRSHGQDVPDPDSQGNVALNPPPGGDASAWNAAMQACQHFLPAGTGSGLDPRDLDKLRAHAVCMRAHGIQMTDPDPITGKSKFEGRLAHASRQQILNDPQFKAAYDACKNLLPADNKTESTHR